MTKQQEKPTVPDASAAKPATDKPLAETELENVSGGLASSVLKKRDDTGNAVIGKI